MEKYRRRNYFIDKSFQTKFILKFCLIVILSSITIAILLFILSRNFTTVAIENAHVTVKSTTSFLAPIIIETLSLVTVFSAICVIMLTLFVSHKIAGPLYRLKKEIDEMKNGNMNLDFRTRKADQVQELANSLADMSKSLTGKHAALKVKFKELKDCAANAGTDKSAIIKKIGEVEEVLNYFKI